MIENDIQKRLEAIEQRNNRVELDKAWETSWVRRAFIMGLTYIVMVAYLAVVIQSRQPLLDALVPAAGYYLSTLVLRAVRKRWELRH